MALCDHLDPAMPETGGLLDFSIKQANKIIFVLVDLSFCTLQ